MTHIEGNSARSASLAIMSSQSTCAKFNAGHDAKRMTKNNLVYAEKQVFKVQRPMYLMGVLVIFGGGGLDTSEASESTDDGAAGRPTDVSRRSTERGTTARYEGD